MLPRPFYDQGWPSARRPAAQALWEWHAAWKESGNDTAGYEADLEAQAGRVAAGEVPEGIDRAIADAALAACRDHGLPIGLLAEQVRGAARWQAPVRLDDAAALRRFLAQTVRPHARLLAHLAETAGSWQLRYVDELADAFFWTAHLLHLPDDLAKDRLFIPLDDLRDAGVTPEQLHQGPGPDGVVPEAVRRLLWKQLVRTRDALGQGQPLLRELPRRMRGPFKRYWIGALELLTQVEQRGYDVWSKPVMLTAFGRAQVWLQAAAGRTSFR